MPKPQDIYDWLSIFASVSVVLGVIWNIRQYLRGMVMEFLQAEIHKVGSSRYFVYFRFSLWNPSSQVKCVQKIGYEYHRSYQYLFRLSEPHRFPVDDTSKLVWVDEQGKQVGESFQDDTFESGLNMESHRGQNISIPLLLDLNSEDIESSLLDMPLCIRFYVVAPKRKRLATCPVNLTLRQLTTPDLALKRHPLILTASASLVIYVFSEALFCASSAV